MKSAFLPRRIAVGTGLLLAAFATGCASTGEPAASKIDGNQYVTFEAPVGSHIKKRVKVSEMQQPGISPTQRNVVTDMSDTNVLPATGGEMEKMRKDSGR